MKEIQRSWVIGASIVLAVAILAVGIVATASWDLSLSSAARVATIVSEDGRKLEAARAQADRDAQARLRAALTAAKAHYTAGSTYAGFDVEAGEAIEPALVWHANTTAAPGIVTINLATDYEVLLSTMGGSGPFCIAEREEDPGFGTHYGRKDGFELTVATTCSGGW
jgi:hypothetical protein